MRTKYFLSTPTFTLPHREGEGNRLGNFKYFWLALTLALRTFLLGFFREIEIVLKEVGRGLSLRRCFLGRTCPFPETFKNGFPS